MTLIPGTRVGAYEILSLVGRGGMGEVYRARDAKLRRDVALKILPGPAIGDVDRGDRLRREARVLAALQHPNIAAVYGIEDDGDVHAIAMEFVEGDTLASRIGRGRGARGLPVREALAIALQICDALDAAHERGIVHRDLKPANIVVDAGGRVRILDFGLATSLPNRIDASDAATITIDPARAGVVSGTIAYMSPEQARGLPVDKRTDIWAFGCVLFEMLSGRRAFAGETMSDTLAAVLEHEAPLDLLPVDAPAPVRRAIARCLERDPRRRARDIADVSADLQSALEPAPVVAAGAARPAWSAIALAAIGGSLLSGIAVWNARRPADRPPAFSRILRVTRGPAHEVGAAVAPDGKWVAYLSDARGPMDVWVQFLGGGEPVNLTASAGLDIATSTGISGLDISPDGTRVGVIAKPHGFTGPFATWEIPAPLPGVPRKLLDDGFMGLRWSPDGRRVTFIRAGPSEGDALWVADADGTNRREIVAAGSGMHIHWPAWSTDGLIYFNRMWSYVGNFDRSEIYRVRGDGTGLEAVVPTLRRAMFALPLADGGLIYAADPSTAELGLWWRSRRGGEPVRLTTGVGEYAEPRVSSDGRSLVATLYELRQSIVRVPLDQGAATPLTDGSGGDLDPSIGAAGASLIFSSSRTGNRHLWTSRLDGSGARPLTSGTSLDERPAVSPDGSQVAFVSDRSGQRAVWTISADGGSPRKVADLSPIGQLAWSRDGRQIVLSAPADKWAGLWSVNVADGTVRRIPTAGAAAEPAWSPTADVIAYLEPSSSGPAYVKLAFVRPDGARVYAALPPAPPISAGFANGSVAWSPHGDRVAIVSQNTNLAAAVWTIAVDDERQSSFRRLVELPVGPRIRGLTWTPDSSAVIIGRHEAASDIVLLDGGAP